MCVEGMRVGGGEGTCSDWGAISFATAITPPLPPVLKLSIWCISWVGGGGGGGIYIGMALPHTCDLPCCISLYIRSHAQDVVLGL